MSARKLRSKLDLKFILPLGTRQRSSDAHIPTDFSEKMFRRHPSASTKSASVIQIESPPPPPPKDNGEHTYSYYSPASPHGAPGEWDDVRYAVMASPISESAPSPPGLNDSTNSHLVILSQVRPPRGYSKLPPLPDEMGVLPPSSPTLPSKPGRPAARSATSRIPIASGRVAAAQRRAATISTPEEAELRRREARLRRELEEQEAQREEADRQARLKHEKQQLLIQAVREDEERKTALEAELRQAAEERRKREAIEREAEALSSMVALEKKRQDRERRRLEAQKMQRMWAELEAERAAQEQERKQWRERVVKERRALAAQLEIQRAKSDRVSTVLLTGWVTVQGEDCLSYKRRYFQLKEDSLVLYKDAEDDTSKPIESIQLSKVVKIREAEDGYEDLAAISNSFALEIRDVRDPWNMFTDTNKDKENLLALLSSRLTTR